jgi:hypothetical protein
MTTEQKIKFDEVTKGLEPSLIKLWEEIAEKCITEEKFNSWIEHIKTERQK